MTGFTDVMRFQQLCKSILEPYLKTDFVKAPLDERYDFSFTDDNGRKGIVEIKYYDSRQVPLSWVTRAVSNLASEKSNANATRAILVMSAVVPSSQLDAFKVVGVDLYDLEALYILATGNQSLTDELDALAPLERDVSVESTPPRQAFTDFLATVTIRRPDLERQKRGEQLCETIKAVPLSQGIPYEKAVRPALEYIFGGDLTKWESQSSTDDDLTRDIVAKIIGVHDFWRHISQDFSTRYVVFECKNYEKKFTQKEVYSTEKYLHQKALRSVAIIVSRKGPDSGAEQAMKGALRESKRLITWLTDDDLCTMLKITDGIQKDKGQDDRYQILVDRVDDALMSIER